MTPRGLLILVGHPGGQPADPRQALVAEQLGLVLLERGGHGVELGGEASELVGAVHVEVGVEVAGGEARGAGLEGHHRPGHRPGDPQAHEGREGHRAQEDAHRPQVGPALDPGDLGLEGPDGRLRALRQGVGAVLDQEHPGELPVVGGPGGGHVVGSHRREDGSAEGPVHGVGGGADLLDRRPVRGGEPALLQIPEEAAHPGPGLAVEGHVALVAQEDGVGLVGVLVADGAAELEDGADLVLLHAHGVAGLAHGGEAPGRLPGGDAEEHHQGAEADEEPAAGAGQVHAESSPRGRVSKGHAAAIIGHAGRAAPGPPAEPRGDRAGGRCSPGRCSAPAPPGSAGRRP